MKGERKAREFKSHAGAATRRCLLLDTDRQTAQGTE